MVKLKKKLCSNCKKSCFIKGKGLCLYCFNKEKMKKVNASPKPKPISLTKGKNPNSVKQKKPGYKRTTYCSESTLDSTVSRLLRLLFPDRCYGVCNPKKKYSFSEVECAHFCGRTHKSTRYLLGNTLPACQSCNRYTPEHIYKLGVNIDAIYGEGSANRMLNLSKRNCKISPKIRKGMNDFLKDVKNQAENIIEQCSKTGEDYKPKLVALAVKTHEEQIKQFIEPNLI